MGIFDFLKKETRADNPDAPPEKGSELLVSMLTGNTKMTTETALQIPAVSRCVDMIASAAAMLPVKLYRKNDDGKVEEVTDDRAEMLCKDTGDTINASDMRKLWVRDYLLKGSAYAYIERKYGVPHALYYISPDDIAVFKPGDDVIHKTFVYSVRGKTYQPYEILKILRNSNGFGKGKGIVEESPLILETMYNLIKFQKNQVLRGGNKKGYLKSPGAVSKPVIADIKTGWSQLYRNENSENVMFLNGDIDFKEMSNTSVEMQLNESFSTNNAEIMRLFGSSDGFLSKDTVKNAVMPVIDTFEAAFDSDLLLEIEKRQGYYFAFDTRELTRGDIQERMSAYAVALKNNIMQVDEVRQLEDLPSLGFNPVRGGLNDVYIFPDKNKIYTPNTNAFVDLGSGSGAAVNAPESIGEVRGNGENATFGEGHKFTGSTPAGGGGSGGSSAKEKNNSEKKENNTEKALDKSEENNSEKEENDSKKTLNKSEENNSEKTLDKSEENDIIKSRPKTPDEVSALGENYFERGFAPKNLEKHWGGSSDHSDQYPALHSAEEYNDYAKSIISSAADGKKILGYKTNDGTVVRYMVGTNDYVKGNPIYDEIYTCFKPNINSSYFHKRKKMDGGIVK